MTNLPNPFTSSASAVAETLPAVVSGKDHDPAGNVEQPMFLQRAG